MLKVFDSDETTVCVEGRNYSVTITESNEGIRVEELDECLGTNDVGDITNPDPYDCDMLLDRIEELSTTIDNFINGYAEDYHGLNSDLSTLEVDVGKLRLDAMAGIDGNQIQATANDADIDTLFDLDKATTLLANMNTEQSQMNTDEIKELLTEDSSLSTRINDINLSVTADINKLDTAISNNIEKITELDTKVKDMCGDACNTAQEIEDLRAENKQFDEWIEAHEGLNNVFEKWADGKIHKLENKTIPECNHSHRGLFSWLFNRR